MTYRILVTGTRNDLTPQQKTIIGDRLYMAHYKARAEGGPDADIVFVHGACPTGVDAYVDAIVPVQRGLSVECHPADWKTHGRAAGPRRNAFMVDLGADICLAFPAGDSKGTRGCVKLAEAAGIPTVVVEL